MKHDLVSLKEMLKAECPVASSKRRWASPFRIR